MDISKSYVSGLALTNQFVYVVCRHAISTLYIHLSEAVEPFCAQKRAPLCSTGWIAIIDHQHMISIFGEQH